MREHGIQIGDKVVYKNPVSGVQTPVIVKQIIYGDLLYVLEQSGRMQYIPASWIVKTVASEISPDFSSRKERPD